MEPNGKVGEQKGQPGDVPRSLPPHLKKCNEKADAIRNACKWKDLDALRTLATSEGGLISDEVRRQAWPLLLGYTRDDSIVKEKEYIDWRLLPNHGDEHQVQLDVDRSFIFYPNDQSSQELDVRKKELSDLITEVLRRQPYLCYFQGYHDICQVFLLVLEPQDRAAAMARLSTLRIRDFMLPTLAPALAQLRLIPNIIYAVDPKLCDHLSQTKPFFALSGTLTMYAHDIQEYGDIARLFDVLLAREAIFSVYMFAQIVLNRSEELFDVPADEPEMLHSILSKLPKPLDLETLISNTVQLFERHPPESLRTWRSISPSSVLKTARWQNQTINQTLRDGEVYFNQQVKELKRAEKREQILKTMWRYRKPAGTVGLAVLVGVLSFILRRHSASFSILGAFWKRWMGYHVE